MWLLDKTILRIPGMTVTHDDRELVDVIDEQTGERLTRLPSVRGIYYYAATRPVRFEQQGRTIGTARPS
jgi:hypothetical protein